MLSFSKSGRPRLECNQDGCRRRFIPRKPVTVESVSWLCDLAENQGWWCSSSGGRDLCPSHRDDKGVR